MRYEVRGIHPALLNLVPHTSGSGPVADDPERTETPPRKIRVGVLFGGQSAEHAVSLASATSIMRALDPDKYEVLPIGITRAGHWLTGGDPLKALRSGVSSGLE